MRKGQAAMEFLMTYGWAILVVLAAIAALAYFGVLSPDRFIPDKCLVQGGGVSCTEFSATQTGGVGNFGQVKFVLTSGGGKDIGGIQVNLTASPSAASTSCLGASNRTAAGPASIVDGETGTYVVDCTQAIGTKFRGNVKVVFTPTQGQLQQTAVGTISVKPQ